MASSTDLGGGHSIFLPFHVPVGPPRNHHGGRPAVFPRRTNRIWYE